MEKKQSQGVWYNLKIQLNLFLLSCHQSLSLAIWKKIERQREERQKERLTDQKGHSHTVTEWKRKSRENFHHWLSMHFNIDRPVDLNEETQLKNGAKRLNSISVTTHIHSCENSVLIFIPFTRSSTYGWCWC